jgi:hypothetical protein
MDSFPKQALLLFLKLTVMPAGLTKTLPGLSTLEGFRNQRPVSVRQPADLTASEKFGRHYKCRPAMGTGLLKTKYPQNELLILFLNALSTLKICSSSHVAVIPVFTIPPTGF